MTTLRPLSSSEQAEIVALIGRVLESVEPTESPRDNYYRNVLEGVSRTLAESGVVEVGRVSPESRVPEIAQESARKASSPPAA